VREAELRIRCRLLELGCVLPHLHREVHASGEGDSQRQLGQEAGDQYHANKQRDVQQHVLCASARRLRFHDGHRNRPLKRGCR